MLRCPLGRVILVPYCKNMSEFHFCKYDVNICYMFDWKRVVKMIWNSILLFILSVIGVFCAINIYIEYGNKDRIFQEVSDLPKTEVLLVLGASVKPDKEMSDVFRDRVDTAIKLYNNGVGNQILVSGDSNDDYYDEPGAAEKYLLKAGIPAGDIILDGDGFDTFHSLHRAKEVHGLSKVIIVTQNFHLPRALYIARSLGMESYGMSADLHRYVIEDKMFYREKLANIKAFIDVNSVLYGY